MKEKNQLLVTNEKRWCGCVDLLYQYVKRFCVRYVKKHQQKRMVLKFHKSAPYSYLHTTFS